MARHGMGHRSSSSHRSGGHSSSRSSGGRRLGSSLSSGSRPGMGGGYSGHSSSGYNNYHHHHHHHHGSYGYGYGGRRSYSSGCSSILAFLILIIIIMVYFGGQAGCAACGIGSGSNITSSSYVREKITPTNSFTTNCIYDELGWFEHKTNTAAQLKNFYDKTGVQPYIYFVSYDPDITTDLQKEKFTEQFFDKEIDDEGAFLFAYFCERDIEEPGYMCYVAGKQAASIMDEEGCNIFFDYVDRYWFDKNIETYDEVMTKAFDSAAKRLMNKPTSFKDVMIFFIIGATIIVVIIVISSLIKAKFRRSKEEAEETQRILNTPMQDLINNQTGGSAYPSQPYQNQQYPNQQYPNQQNAYQSHYSSQHQNPYQPQAPIQPQGYHNQSNDPGMQDLMNKYDNQ